jgi:tetratricopeptide (TPR) repeat protein
LGDRATEPNTLTNLSVLALRQGDDSRALAYGQAAVDIAIEVQSPVFEAIALCSLGNAEMALGRHSEAAAAFERAHQIARGLDNATQHDAAAGLARVALAQEDAGSAMRIVEVLLTHLAADSKLDGSEAPYLICLTCHQVLAKVGDSRADTLLGSAHAELLAQAITIGDPARRHSFLNNIPEHRSIMAAWKSAPVGRL